MYTASYVSNELARWKADGVVRAIMVRNLAYLCKGWLYVFGAAGEMCTVKNRKSYAGNRPDHADSIYKACPVLSDKQPACDGCDWVDTRIYDCRGFTRWLLSMVGVPLFGGTVTDQWEARGNWAIKGDIQDMPKGLVCCVFRPSHTGMYMGNGSVIHCGGKKGQVVEEELPGSPKWERFGIPAGLYTNAELEAAGVKFDPAKNIPTLRRGNSGEAVKALQEKLNGFGASLNPDGIFGAKTEAAVKAFQKAHGLTADGIVGAKTMAVLGIQAQGGASVKPEMQDTPQPIDRYRYTWDTLLAAIKNPYGVAGLMGNLQAESGINSENLQNTGERALGMSDQQYTEAVDLGTYTSDQFANDGYGYGIAQWTYKTRKAALLKYAHEREFSIGDLGMQVDFLLDELRFDYSRTWYTLQNSTSVREASDAVLLDFERPKNQSEENKIRRAELGQKFYDEYVVVEEHQETKPSEIESLETRVSKLENQVLYLLNAIRSKQ